MRQITAVVVLTFNFQFLCLTSLAKCNHEVTTIFEGLGYSPVCVASALASCERFAKPDCYLHVLYLMPELKSLLQGIKCENKSASLPEDTFRNIEVQRKEGNSEQSQFASGEILRNLTNLIAAINDSAKEEIKNIRSDLYEILFDLKKINAVLSESKEINTVFSDLKEINTVLNGSKEINAVLSDLKEINTVLGDLKAEKLGCMDIMKESSLFRDWLMSKNSTKNQSGFITKYDLESSHDTTNNDVDNKAKNCAEVSKSCLATVYPYEDINEDRPQPVLVPCVDLFDGGKWTVIQNRDIAFQRQNFNRPWSDYVTGFGDANGEFWLGLENIQALTNSSEMELRVDLEDYEGVKKYAKYDSIKIGNASTKYILTVGKYSGDAGDSLSYHNGSSFSTYDQDNDESEGNCAYTFRGGWWFNACYRSNLNGYQRVGKYSSEYSDGIAWNNFHLLKYSLRKVNVKIRPVY